MKRLAPTPETDAHDPGPLLAEAGQYLSADELATLRRACAFAAAAHEGQQRASGDPYIAHPLAVALTLAELRLDAAALVAAVLHDVPEDTGVPLEAIEREFGAEVARLVDGVTKLGKMQWRPGDGDGHVSRSEESAWAESLRKMFLAMAEDIRVVLIKLADRLHNMRTLQYLPPDKQRRIAQETMDIYAPLANRLGIWQIKWQLEDLAFRYLEPERYREIARRLDLGRRAVREEYIERVIRILQAELERHGIKAEISGRPKHIYSIYRKMQRRGVDLDQIYDLLAVRVLVREVQECYHVLGIVHALWHPLPGQFDDYIASPKESLYQSLHTTVVGPEGRPLEVQIRTYEMHHVAEYGVAAHWRYKEGGKRDEKFDAKVAWLRQLMDWHKDVLGSAQEFVDSLKTDLFQDQVYVFTPRGEIKELPAGATPLDFAYRIHTEVGHRCVGAKVNGRLVPLNTTLRNGDVVEIITAKSTRGPSRDWLNPALGYLKTAHAREKVRQWFRKQQREESIARGRELVEKELHRLGLENVVKLEELARSFRYERVEDFLAAVGYADINPQQIATKLSNELAPPPPPPPAPPAAPGDNAVRGLRVRGVGDLLTRLAHCCNPVPGDPVVGYITRGRGVTVHRADCPSVLREDEPERLVEVDWGHVRQQVFPVAIRIEAWDREGLLRDISAIVADENINIAALNVETHKDGTAIAHATLDVDSLARLSRVMTRLEAVRDVRRVAREQLPAPR
ncbi:MAG TPA: bifunctional (p)ppGpp synthetase/guanosine-3',5'-bis(diphosphate) 3'-pyrophosphohydrolase [Chloroflexota bacterium]|nr:bifunctional (p)ppGpp synthetase/guanosine-3',5'-bis(diphosphate) 3'-pyrophosphohydrolase [Chloroflexota bacterium]